MSEPAAATLVARTARAVAAAEWPDQALKAVLTTLRQHLHAPGAALLRAEDGALVPSAEDGMHASARAMVDSEALREDGGGYPLVLGGRLEGVLLVRGVDEERLAAEEPALVALLDLAAIALRNARFMEERASAQQQAEIQSLERLSAPPGTAVTARSFSGGALREREAQHFQSLVERYARLLDRQLEERAYRLDNTVSDGLRDLADALGRLHAAPRDVVELHTTALRGRIAPSNPQKAQAYVEEARVAVLEVMGYLASYYRTWR